MIPIELRDYQVAEVEAIDRRWRLGEKRTLISAPTGVGKTIVFVAIAKTALGNRKRTLVLVNSDELINQSLRKFADVGIWAGIIKQSMNNWQMDIVVGSIQTVVRRLGFIPRDAFDLIVIDECHFANAAIYRKVMNHFSDRYFLGVSATLFRGDGQSLALAGWESIAHIYTIDEALRDGWLVPPVAYRIKTGTNLGNTIGLGDNVPGGIEHRINSAARNELIVDSWIKYSSDRRTIGFCAGIKHVYSLTNAFRARGIDARPVEGKMPLWSRRETLVDHQMGRFPVLLNFGILTHGYDDPQLSCILMARPVNSKTLFIQCVGRGLRRSPETGKKDCQVLDFVDVCAGQTLVTAPDVIQLCQDIKEMSGESIEHGAKYVAPIKPRTRPLPKPAPPSEPASRQRLSELFEKLKTQLGWPVGAAKKAVFENPMSEVDVEQFWKRARLGTEAASDYE